MYVSINSEKTGANLKSLFKNNGYSVRDIQSVMGFENPQSIYKWLSGRSLPSLDNLVILSKVLHTTIEDILVVDGDVVFLHLYYRVSTLSFLIFLFRFTSIPYNNEIKGRSK
ncbi:helix-turn-helix transcriptional regulator (plasmid) [Ligilactobacillus salivarius]|uniref:Helix-turn-helix transcriptional regulator n=4 Tax=Ligilactobacillus salivarius TaxID=1624 RepID=A0ABD7YXW7_9LACO|nr:helix-turn-helix transcriptional regulator [Ligilactobacillus salivarius]WHS15263.1 helix-turn-helix transcriptional regulator [Ligilactobacillus salivarius]WHS18783.1 helix-turn-helix transcriptional regulator [Ligilactobacillus salivarius]WHS21510.1 helix-turn-helix transcriptional regulator [Ligilactobacillus salivarius]